MLYYLSLTRFYLPETLILESTILTIPALAYCLSSSKTSPHYGYNDSDLLFECFGRGRTVAPKYTGRVRGLEKRLDPLKSWPKIAALFPRYPENQTLIDQYATISAAAWDEHTTAMRERLGADFSTLEVLHSLEGLQYNKATGPDLVRNELN